MDLAKFQRTTSNGKSTKKTISFAHGTRGYALVAKAQTEGYDVAKLTEALLEEAFKGK